MRRAKISETIGNIQEKYIEEATAYAGKGKAARHAGWGKWAIAACFAVVLIAGALVLLSLLQGNQNAVLLGGLTRPYKDVKVRAGEADIEWPWEYKTVYEQYPTMIFNGKEYQTRARSIDLSLLGDAIGSCNASGYDTYTDQEYHRTFVVRQIRDVSSELLVAVQMEEDFYVFLCNAYVPPSAFGQLLDSSNLPQTLELKHFTKHEGYDEAGYFNLENDDGIWQLLSACRDAKFIEDPSWSLSDKNYISFTATSEELGVYKKAFYITEDGYIWTNIFNRSFIYYIGENTAEQILRYAAEHSTEADLEPYSYSLVGTVVEIREDYILVDDSVSCKDSDDGMIFKVPANHLLIKRYIECYHIQTGDLVMIQFTGDIDAASGNTVNGAYEISEAIIADGNVWVAE